MCALLCKCCHYLDILSKIGTKSSSTHLWNVSMLSSFPTALLPTLWILIWLFHSGVYSLSWASCLWARGLGGKELLHKLSLPGISIWLIRGYGCIYELRGGGEAARQKYTREQSVTITGWPDGLLSKEKGQVTFYISNGWDPIAEQRFWNGTLGLTLFKFEFQIPLRDYTIK